MTIIQKLVLQLRLVISVPKNNDMLVFWHYAEKMKHGLFPYFGFHPEYPPLAFLFIYFPYFFTHDPLFYQFLFSIEVFFAVCVGICILWVWTKEVGKIWLFLLLLTIMQASEYHLLFGRFDIFVAVLTMVSFFIFFKMHKEGLGWFFLFLGVMTKLYPLVLLPLLFVKGKSKTAFLWFLIPFLLINGALLVLTHGQYSNFLLKQVNRPAVELESIEAGFLLGLYIVGNFPIKLITDLGGVGIPISGLLNFFLQVLLVVLLGLPIMSMRKYILKFKPERQALVLITLFILLNSTLSPQFLIWIIPFIPFLSLPEIVLMILITALTSWFFSFWTALTQWLAFLIVLRNILLIVFYYLMFFEGKKEFFVSVKKKVLP